jgi:hypothetical protein
MNKLWVMKTENPDEENPTWSEPRLLGMETHNMNKPTVLADGTWIWPTSPVSSDRGLMPRPLYSSDGGKTASRLVVNKAAGFNPVHQKKGQGG